MASADYEIKLTHASIILQSWPQITVSNDNLEMLMKSHFPIALLKPQHEIPPAPTNTVTPCFFQLSDYSSIPPPPNGSLYLAKSSSLSSNIWYGQHQRGKKLLNAHVVLLQYSLVKVWGKSGRNGRRVLPIEFLTFILHCVA